jgi:hypothetical protein
MVIIHLYLILVIDIGMNSNKTISTQVMVLAVVAIVMLVGSAVVVVLPEVSAVRPLFLPTCNDDNPKNDRPCRARP